MLRLLFHTNVDGYLKVSKTKTKENEKKKSIFK